MERKVFGTSVLCLVLCLNFVSSQRGSYAGMRPPNGLRDKYRPTQSPASVELANRIGDETLPNGAPQKPPQGLPVISAEPGFSPVLANRLSNDDSQSIQAAAATPPSRLPYDAYGDQQLVDYISKLPVDQQPFWYLNYHAIEAHRNSSGNATPVSVPNSSFGK